MGKLKYSLISLLAVCLTAGGVFAAWTFSDGSIENPDPVGVDVSTEGLGGMEFMQVNVKFNSNGGQFPDGTTEKSVISKKYQAITADAYTSIFKSFADFPTKEEGGVKYYFSNWSLTPNGTDYFSFDNGFTEDSILYAQYVPETNPAIYKDYNEEGVADELVGYFKINSGTEYHLRNFIAEGMKNNSNNDRNFHYVIKKGSNSYPVLSSSVGTYTYSGLGYEGHTFTIEEGKDYVIKGLYNIYFDESKNPSTDMANHEVGWILYGGKAFFEPQYNYRLVGNPVASDNEGGWDDPSPNPVTFRWVKDETISGQLVKTYVIDKVDFPTYAGEAVRDFKPYITHFGIYPLRSNTEATQNLYPVMERADDDVTKAHLTYVSESDNGTNFKIADGSTNVAYKVTMKVTYEERNPFWAYYNENVQETYYTFNNYPVNMEVALEPFEHKINIYDNKDDTTPTPIAVESNKVWSSYNTSYPSKTHDLISKKYQGTAWRDYYTNEIIDFSSLNINKSYHIYPVYNEISATSYNLTLSVFSGSGYTNVVIPMYEGHTVQENVTYYLSAKETQNTYDAAITKYLGSTSAKPDLPTGSDSNSINTSYTFDNYVKGTALSSATTYTVSQLLSSTLTANTTYKARYKSSNKVGAYYSSNSSSGLIYFNSSLSDKTIYNYSSKGVQTNYYLYSYGFDPKTTTSGYNLQTTSGVYKITVSGSTYTIERKIKMNISNATWWDDSSAYMFVYSWGGAASVWSYKISSDLSNNECAYYIPYDNKSLLFLRRSDNVQSFDNKWNQTVDASISYCSSSEYTFYITDYAGNNTDNKQVYLKRSAGDYWWK